MSNLRKIGVVLATVFAFAAIAASSASAQVFTFSSKGAEITGMSTTAQVFNTTAGSNLNKVTCNTATVTGTTSNIDFHEQTVTVNYSSSTNGLCNAFIGTANISAVNYLITLANGNSSNTLDTAAVDIENAVNISTNVGCNVQVPAQVTHNVTIENDGTKAINVIASANGIISNGNGGLCGTHHENGSYVGTTTLDSNSVVQFDVTG